MKIKWVVLLSGPFLVFLVSSAFAGDIQTGLEGTTAQPLVYQRQVNIINGRVGSGVLWNRLKYNQEAMGFLKPTDNSREISDSRKAGYLEYFHASGAQEVIPFDDNDIMNTSFSKPRNNAYVLGLKLTLKGIGYGREAYRSSRSSVTHYGEQDKRVLFSIFFDAPDPGKGI